MEDLNPKLPGKIIQFRNLHQPLLALPSLEVVSVTGEWGKSLSSRSLSGCDALKEFFDTS
jgi:hypothetical protein